MRISNSYSKWLLLSVFVMGIYNSCTDLDEELFDQVTADNFFNTDEEFISALGAAYTSLYGVMGGHNATWSIQEVSTDEFIVPQRGQDWFDGGIWLRMHRHEYNPSEDYFNNAWNQMYSGISNCNRLIFQFEQLDAEGSDAFIAELKVLRALFYYWLLDMFGNVPIIETFDVPEGFSPPNNSRQEVFNFVEQELLANLDLVTETVGGEAYARINKFATHAILAKLYLNSEVYIGTPRWEDAIAQCDEIINSGNYNLEPNYFSNFQADNSVSAENIFVIPYDEVFATGFNIPQMTLHYASQATFNLAAQPWNGYCTLQEFYESYADDDVRKQGFLEGPQFTVTGERVVDNGAETSDPDGPPLTFTPEINEHFPNAIRQAGVRAAKFEYEVGAQPDLNNDFPIFRYGDVLLMKAEALMRLGNTSEALPLANEIHTRAGLAPYTADQLTLDELLAERGREMFMEGYRRQDLIRFGKYNDPWEFKPASDPFRNIFPIPVQQLDANKSLTQNPGY